MVVPAPFWGGEHSQMSLSGTTFAFLWRSKSHNRLWQLLILPRLLSQSSDYADKPHSQTSIVLQSQSKFENKGRKLDLHKIQQNINVKYKKYGFGIKQMRLINSNESNHRHLKSVLLYLPCMTSCNREL